MPLRKIYFIDRRMCERRDLPNDFDLESFCEFLQGKVPELEIEPITSDEPANNRAQMISDDIFDSALGEFCHF